MSAIAFSGSIGPILIDCVISERPSAELEITELPVENGARITDHALVLPKCVELDIAASDASATYNALVAFQERREPFTLVTGLSVCENMLIRRIDPIRDAIFCQILRARVVLQEIVIVETAYASDPGEGTNGAGAAGNQRGQAGGKNSTRAAPPSPARSGDTITSDRASGIVQRGDAGMTNATAKDRSMLNSMFGG